MNRPGFGFDGKPARACESVFRLADPGTGELVGITDVGARIADVAGSDQARKSAAAATAGWNCPRLSVRAVHQGGAICRSRLRSGATSWVSADLSASPGLMILGRQGCGHGAGDHRQAVMNRFGAAGATPLIDPKRLRTVTRSARPWVCARVCPYDQNEIDGVITELAQQILLPRLPPKGLSQEELRASRGKDRGAAHRRRAGPAAGSNTHRSRR